MNLVAIRNPPTKIQWSSGADTQALLPSGLCCMEKSGLNHIKGPELPSEGYNDASCPKVIILLLQLENFSQTPLGEHPRQQLPGPLVVQLDQKGGGCEYSNSSAVSKVTSPLLPILGLKLRNPEMTTASGHFVQKWEMSLIRSSPVSNQNRQPTDSGTKGLIILHVSCMHWSKGDSVEQQLIQSSLNSSGLGRKLLVINCSKYTGSGPGRENHFNGQSRCC